MGENGDAQGVGSGMDQEIATPMYWFVTRQVRFLIILIKIFELEL